MKSQKEGEWVGLLGVPILLIPSLVAVLIAYDKGMSFAPLLMFTVTVIVGGLCWLLPFVQGKSHKDRKKICFDERDQSIHKKAVMAAYVALWLYFVTACVTTWCIVGPTGSVSVNVMPLTLVGGLVVFIFVQSLAAMIQYGRVGKNVEK